MKQEMYAHIHTVETSHWWYVARRKIIFDWVLQILANYQTPHILDVGCGTGFNLDYLRDQGYTQVTGLDFSSDALKFCLSRDLSSMIYGDGAVPPLRNESFDLIMALDFIEHLEYDIAALQDLARLLKPGGSLVIFVPAFNFLWGLQDEVSHHYRRYTAGDLRKKLQKTDLTISKLSYANTFLFPAIWAGRQLISLSGNNVQGTSENDLHPGWSNGILQAIFAAERPLLRFMNLPVGVSLLCVASKPQIVDN
ncbi:MAG: class I SAM-dependent methyltransferase [Chloroflexota bacterium]